ncbi:MBL fold metallo-hydrolase [candidate division WOR-3 bacterium]|nr:MBL fold metallo-hydrolase [candidate division WOR-3 bacterium]
MYKLSGIILLSVFASFANAPASPACLAESRRASQGGKDLNLTIIYDNNPYLPVPILSGQAGNKELETRWGFSCLIEGLEKTVIFDVGGEGSVLLKNMEKLSINLDSIDIVILSHIHYDHIGGLSDFLDKNPNVTVYMPKSLPKSIKDEVKEAEAKLIEVHKPIKICKNAYSTGELGTFIKEQSLAIKTSKGLVIITGCAHPGIVNIVKKAKKMLNDDVYLVLGGFHLCWMNGYQIKRIVKGIKGEKVKKAAPCHCSGDLARKLFKKVYGKDFILAGAGKKIKIEDAF